MRTTGLIGRKLEHFLIGFFEKRKIVNVHAGVPSKVVKREPVSFLGYA